MKKNYFYIFLFLCANIVSARELLPATIDSLVTKEKDTTLAKAKKTAHLNYLEQLRKIKQKQNISTPPLGELEEAKTFRSFPTLDEKILENNNFNVSFANRKPEFTPEFIAANFEGNPKVDTLMAQAKKAFNAVKELGNFVDIITGNELLQLPVGLTKKDSTSGNSVQLAITQVKFTPQYAEFKAWGKLTIPQKGEDGSPERDLFFGAEGIKMTHDGALVGGMKLVLLGNQAIPINGDNWLLTLKGGVNLKTGAFNEQSFIEFDCSGLKEIALEGDVRVSRNVLLPIDDDGNYVCGDSKDTQFQKDKDKVINNKCYVGASFSVKANGWNDLLMEVNLPRFEVQGLKGWGFNIEKAVLDLSDSKSAAGLIFPEGYDKLYPGNDRLLWRGFYAKELSVMLPKGIENTKSSEKRVKFGAENLILDSQGVSGRFFGENILKTGDGAAGKWAFTIDDISLTLAMNSISGGSIGGDIAVPILDEPMEYLGLIHQDGYELGVTLKSDYKASVFLGEMVLKPNSKVSIGVIDGNVYPYANLTGSLSIMGKVNQKEGDTPPPQENTDEKGSEGFSFKGITFEELELQTEPGKKALQAKSFGYEGEMKLMGFPATIGDLKLVTPGNQAGLTFDLKVNLDSGGSHAATSLQVLGKLEDGAKIQEWKFEQVKVTGFAIDYTKGNLRIAGKLDVMEDDPLYGDGFSGELSATFKQLNFKATGRAMFGKKEFRYWFVDIWMEKTSSTGKTKLPIKSFVGGVSNQMRKVSGNSTGFDPGSAVYEPDANTGLGVRAGVKITTENSDAFSGKAYLEMEYNIHGGLNRIGFMGEGAFMGDDSSGGGAEETKKVGGVFGKINDYVEKNKDKADELSKYGNFLGLSKEAIPVHDVAASGAIGVFVGIEKDFVNGTFDGEFELYMDLAGVKGGGENNLAGYAKIHTGPNDWYLHIGTPQQRIELLFNFTPIQIRVGGYFMTGTKLPDQLDPHPIVVKILGDDMLNGDRKENQLTAGKGFAFGMNFGYGYAFDWGLFYAFVEIGAGFDVMHAYYPNAKCVGRPGPVGNDGWYSMGQVYAYLYGEFGIKVDLAFIKGNFIIAEAGVAALLRGQFPNPVYIQGYVGMYYKILGGLVSGRMRMKVEVGEECILTNMVEGVGVPMISDISPGDKTDDASVFTAPQAVFNYAANTPFTVEMDEGVRIFKLQLKNFTVTCEGQEIQGEFSWNDANDGVTFMPAETLPAEKEIKVVVEVTFDEKIGGAFQTMVADGKPIVEQKEITFTTDKAPDHIVWENVAYMYPIKEQQSFYPEEYKTGYVKMTIPQNYLFDGGYELRAEFVSTLTGQGERTTLNYDKSKGTVFFDVPEIVLDSDYTLNLMIYPPGQDIATAIVVENTEILTDEEEGDTTWFNVDSGTQETTKTSASVVVANKKAANATISNAAPKSIFDFNFKTSKHASFKDKVRSLNVTNNLLNYISANVHSLSIKVDNYEYLDKMEILGDRYTGGEPLIYAQAILDDSYYKNQIFPLLYDKYPLDGDIRVDREEEILGVPPIRSFYIGNEYLANIDDNPNSHWVKNRIPFVYNLPLQYKKDFLHLRNRITNRYTNTGGNTEFYNSYKYIITRAFPALPLGKFKSQIIYQTPGKMYQKGYEIKYINE